jgi:hypothetical protein
MYELHLDEEERVTLQHLLDNCLSDLRMEISHTDSYKFKEMLRDRKNVLMKIKSAITSVPLAE